METPYLLGRVVGIIAYAISEPPVFSGCDSQFAFAIWDVSAGYVQRLIDEKKAKGEAVDNPLLVAMSIVEEHRASGTILKLLVRGSAMYLEEDPPRPPSTTSAHPS